MRPTSGLNSLLATSGGDEQSYFWGSRFECPVARPVDEKGKARDEANFSDSQSGCDFMERQQANKPQAVSSSER